jgi:hypothetical protein
VVWRVVSLRRLGLQAVALAAAGLAVLAWLGRPNPPAGGWNDWNVPPWAAAPVAARRPPAAETLTSVTLLAVPEARAGGATVLRDGLPVARFAGGPVTVVAAPGDDLAVDARGVGGLAVRVLATAPGVRAPQRGAWIPLGTGVTDLGAVRLVAPAGASVAARAGAP